MRPRGGGAREFPPLEVTSAGRLCRRRCSRALGTRRWRRERAPRASPPPAALSSLPRAAVAATHESAAGGQVRTRRGPAGGGGRPRPGQC